MKTKVGVRQSIELLENNVQQIIEEIKRLKQLLNEEEAFEQAAKVTELEVVLQQNLDKFIQFPLPTNKEAHFIELEFEHKIISHHLVEELDELLDERKSRDDSFEYSHLANLINYLKALTNKNINSKYRVSDLYEDGWHSTSPVKVIADHKKREEILEIIPEPYYARIDVDEFDENIKSTYYIGIRGFDGQGRDDFIITNWETSIGELFEQKERYFNQVIDHPKLGKVKLTFARNIEIDQGQIIKLHKPIGETIHNEALIQKLASKHGVDMDTIVETIDAEQSDIIRMPINENETIIIQGSAGSGKSAIALQRIRFLLTEYRNEIKSEDSIAFFGPNELFLKHVQKVLPRLGTYKVIQSTLSNYLGDIVGVKDFHKIRYNHETRLKTSLAYKEWIEQKTNELFNDLKCWNTALVLDKQFTIPALKIIEIADQSLKYPYLQRINYMVQTIGQEARAMREIERNIFQGLDNHIETIIDNELKALFKIMPQSIEDLSDILLAETVVALNELVQKIKADKRKNSTNEISFSAVSKEARDAQSTFIDHIKKDFAQLTNKFKNEMIKARTLFEEHIAQAYEENRLRVIEEKRKAFISTRVSQHIDIQHPTLIVSYEEFIAHPHVQQVITNATKEFDNNYLTAIERELTKQLDSIPSYFANHWAFQFQVKLNRHIRDLYLKEKVSLPARMYEVKKPGKFDNVTTSELKLDADIIRQCVQKQFLHTPAAVLREIYHSQQSAMETLDSQIVKDVHSLRIDEAFDQYDLLALFNIHLIMTGGTGFKKLHYLIVDEAQDYSPYELWCLSQLTIKQSMMLLGDLAQNINQVNPFTSWQEYTALFPSISFYNLKKTYRSTKQIVEYCNKIIEPYAYGKFMLPSTIYREGPTVREIESSNVIEEVKKNANHLVEADDTYQTIAVVCKDYHEANKVFKGLQQAEFEVVWQKSVDESIESKFVVIEAPLSKGLEFDCVIIPNLASYDNTLDDRKLAYVATSRALHELVVVIEGERQL
ncbi:3'-5' exonuclease [Lysinibacillus boronitolerans]|uniref:3'-5' exonuclease n=1 Tax=Lysinibacillus boronitolerans TaxID=309788 RepID=UPI00289E66C0|nr:3'-5' exonuclease [Bacillus mobilis]